MHQGINRHPYGVDSRFYEERDICDMSDARFVFRNQFSTVNGNTRFTIRPNPFSSYTTLTIEGDIDFNKTELRVVDVLGRVIIHEKVSSFEVIINKDQMVPGVYMLQIIEANQTIFNCRIVKN